MHTHLPSQDFANLVRSNLPSHLSDAGFEAVFGMTRPEYLTLPKWRRDKRAKALGLF